MSKIKNKIFLNYLATLVEGKRLCPSYSLLTMKNKTEYYKWLYRKCNDIIEENKYYKDDDFWLKLTKIIIDNNIMIINDTSLKFIKRLL